MGFIFMVTMLLFFIAFMLEDIYFRPSGQDFKHPWWYLITNVIMSVIMAWVFVSWIF